MADLKLNRFETAFVASLEREASAAIRTGLRELLRARGIDPDEVLWAIGKDEQGAYVLRLPEPPKLTNGHIDQIVPDGKSPLGEANAGTA